MLDRGQLIQLPDDVFRLLRDYISDYCGIYFGDTSKYILEKKLNKRLKIHRLDNFRDYYRFLLYDGRKEEELSAAVEVLTINETYFFREQNQFGALIGEIWEELKTLKKEQRRIRIWSAGCSSGEEPYTLAMLMLEHMDLFKGWDIEIVGSDINHNVLQAARKGVYRDNSFRTTEDYYIRKYFVKEDGFYRIKDEVKGLVDFNCLNLLDPVKTRFVGTMDVIFCRNVLIYFNQQARKRLIDGFYQRLSYGGYLLLGHSESLMNLSTAFTLKHFKKDMVYQKPKKVAVSMSDETLFKMVWKR